MKSKFSLLVENFNVPALGLNHKNLRPVICGLVNAVNDLREEINGLIECGEAVRCAYSGKLVRKSDSIRLFHSHVDVWIGAVEDIYWDEDAFESEEEEKHFHAAVMHHFCEWQLYREHDFKTVSLLRFAPLYRVAYELGFRPGVKRCELKCADLIPIRFRY